MKKLKSCLALIAIALTIVTFTTCSMGPSEVRNTPKGPLDEPSFIAKAELEIFDGSTLLFSEKPVRVQWGIGHQNISAIAFVFPLHTRIVQRWKGELASIEIIKKA